VLAAEAEGIGVQEFVDNNAAAFIALAGPLTLSPDDVIRTSRDPRHRVGVERFWRACAEFGDLYRKDYEGLYCVGCEQFYTPSEPDGGCCPEHGTAPQQVSEENWFFRLSRYTARLHELISTGALRVEPPNAATKSSPSSQAGWRISPSPGPPPAHAAGASRYPATRAR